MTIPLAHRIGWRYFRSSRDFLRSVASIAMLGFAFSVAILVVTQAIISGFETELRDRVLNLIPHITIQSHGGTMDLNQLENQLEDLSFEYRGSPEIEIDGLIVVHPQAGLNEEASERHGRVEVARLTGINPDRHLRSSTIEEFVDFDAMSRLTSGSFQILLGRDKARELKVTTGDFVTVVMKEATLTLVGAVPRQRRFQVAGIIDTRTFLDALTAYIHIDDAARLRRLNEGITTYRLQIDDPFDAVRLASEILARELRLTSSYSVSTWFSKEKYGGLADRIAASRNLLVLIFSLMVAIAAFNLISTVVVFVNERKEDIAVLRTLGGGRILIGSSFLITGFMISLLGLLSGGVLGVLMGYGLELGLPIFSNLLSINLLEGYFVQELNIEFVVSDLFLVAVIGLSLTILAAIYPAWRAMRLDPVEILRSD